MPSISIEPVRDFSALGERWRALEAASDARFFRGWTYLGCDVAKRFAGALLLAVREGRQDQGLALLGRAGGALLLNETGDPVQDAPYIEHNGLLLRHGARPVIAAALRAASHEGRALRLSGIDTAHLEAARSCGWVALSARSVAPAVDLAALRGPFLDTLSANARAQIRRAERGFGPGLAIRRAASVGEALDVFEELVTLHQARWTAAGAPGAFGDPRVADFHRALIARGVPTGEVELLRVSAGPRTIGALYSMLSADRAMSYQSGFCAAQDAREKPGLVCHAMAIALHAREGRRVYDFLAGEGRYKTTLASGTGGRGTWETLHWATLTRFASLRGASAALIQRLRPPA